MTPAAADQVRKIYYNQNEGYGPVDGGSELFKNAIWQVNALGMLIPCSTNPNLPIAGLGRGHYDNSGGSDSDITEALYSRDWEALFAKSGTVDDTDIMQPVSFIDDITVARALGTYASPTGVANSAFTIVSKVKGARINFALIEDGASQTLKVEVYGNYPSYTIRVRAKTTAGSAQDNTTDEIKAAIAAHTLANSLITIADLDGHDGTGKPAAIAETELTLPGPLALCTGIEGSLVRVRNKAA